MAAMPNADPRRMYSWWWDSHISPKNSKWLHENLTDMDSKVNQMIKLIEEDADSFARRAEMYYKKRPELMKMVEDFYRAYRALAARYDHATGVLRQAHRTMSEAFPNQIPLLGDDSPAGSAADSDPSTPEMPSTRPLFDPDELQKDAMGTGLSSSHYHPIKRNGAFTEDSDSVTSRKGLKELNDLLGSGGTTPIIAKFTEGRARKGLHFLDSEEKERRTRTLSESDRVSKAETEIIALKNAIAKLEAEKEAGLAQYQQSLDRLSKLESEVSCAQEDSRGLNERASKAESEVQTLKELLSKLEAEREVSLLQYEQCLEKMSNLEKIVLHTQKDAGELDERASKAELEAESLKQELAMIKAEKEASLLQYKQCLEKLQHAEEEARRMKEKAEKAESEVEALKQALAKLTEEKEAAALQYQQCLELISSLEHELACAQEETQKLKCELDDGVEKLRGSEGKCVLLERSNQTLNSELESVVQKMEGQSHELTEKQKELGTLWTCIQEERFRFMEAETAFQTLQQLHSQSQVELRSLAAELQQRAQILKDMEALSQGLQDEIQKVKEENKGLNQVNASSALSIASLEGEILMLRETERKLEAEIELQVDQRRALQQEIYSLKQELNVLNQNHQAVLQQVDSVGLDHECFGSSVKKLQDENSELKEICVRDSNEKAILEEKLEQMEKLLEKNATLENSILGLNVELEGVRGKVRAVEESYEHLLSEKSSLVAEKAVLISQLEITIQSMEKVSEEKKLLESSLLDAKAELEGLRVRSKSLEDSCMFLNDEKSCLMVEREHLVSQLDITQKRLEDLEESHMELNEKYLNLEKERVIILSRLEELQASLDAEKQEHASLAQLSGTQMAAMTSRIHLLQEEGCHWKKESGEQLDNAVGAQIEIFILQKCVQDLEENNFSLISECKKLLEASKSSEKQMSKLEHENQEQQLKVKSLLSQIQILRMGLYQLSKTLDIDVDHDSEDKNLQDIEFLNNVLRRLEETSDENQKLVLEKSVILTLLGQLRVEAENLASERNVLSQELSMKSEQFLLLKAETQKLSNINEDLRLQVHDGEIKNEFLIVELESLLGKQCSLNEAYQNLQAEKSKLLGELRSLMKEISMLEEQNCVMEEENLDIIEENISRDTLSLILKNIVSEKSIELKELSENLEGLACVCLDLEEKVREKERELEASQAENLVLKESLEKSEVDLRLVTSVSDRLAKELATGKDLLHHKESELLEAEQKLNVLLNEKTELLTLHEDLKMEYDEVKTVQDNQEKQILNLSEENGLRAKEIESMSEANQKLEAKLRAANLECEETKLREKSLSDEVELWETEAATFFFEQQTSTIHEALFEQKVHELAELCQSLEDRSKARDMEIEVLKEKVCALEDKDEGLNDQLAAYTSAVLSLTSCVTSLENHTMLHAELQKAHSRDTKDANFTGHRHKNGDSISNAHDGISKLHDLEARIKGVDKAVVEMERLAMLEHLDTITKLEAAMKQIEELKSRKCSKQENANTRKMQNPVPEISEVGNEVLTKDIMLDQISESSSYGISKRQNVGPDQMLELWETTDHDETESIDSQRLTIGHKTLHPTIESLVEKELGVDKLEVSKRATDPRQEVNRKKVLERLDSDAQKLTNLQITVQDLKSKAEMTEKSKKGKGIEYDSVKEQLEETEEAIMKLLDANHKLTNYVDDGQFSSGGKSTGEPDETGNARRRRVVEQARKGSERIGRLQLEVQKIQFLLLKLVNEKEKKVKTRITEPNPTVLLRDYLYGGGGGGKANEKRKKKNFCACVRPPTRGD